MKTRIRPTQQKRNDSRRTTHSVPPTVEEIRQRAHEIFLARGSTPGKELDDWLRAEQELKQERPGPNTDTTQR